MAFLLLETVLLYKHDIKFEILSFILTIIRIQIMLPNYYACCINNDLSVSSQVFYGVLLQYFAVLANRKPLNFELLNLLVKPLMEMSIEIPYFSAICARQRILRTRGQFCEAIMNTGWF